MTKDSIIFIGITPNYTPTYSSGCFGLVIDTHDHGEYLIIDFDPKYNFTIPDHPAAQGQLGHITKQYNHVVGFTATNFFLTKVANINDLDWVSKISKFIIPDLRKEAIYKKIEYLDTKFKQSQEAKKYEISLDPFDLYREMVMPDTVIDGTRRRTFSYDPPNSAQVFSNEPLRFASLDWIATTYTTSSITDDERNF